MNLELFIRKPVLAIALCLLIVLLGVAAYYKLPVRQFPLLPSSKVVITTVYPGASPKVMEGFVSQPMEEALSGLNYMDYISSSNTEGQSVVTIKFHLGTDVDAMLPQISNRISSLMWQLPKGINSPSIAKIDPNAAATGAILYIDGHSTELSEEQMTEYLERTVRPRFEAIKGVAQVQIFGSREYAMRIWLDTGKMAAHNVSAQDIRQALLTHNLRSASGKLQGKYMEFDVGTSSNLSTAKAFNDIVIKSDKGSYVRIRDVGRAELGATDYQTSAYTNGKPTVMMGVETTDTANSIATATRVLHSLKLLQHVLPPGMHVNLVWDVTQFARQSIKEVHITIVEAACFVFIVVFLFLGSLRSIIVPMVTIPLSMLGAAAIMFAMGYSLNTLTLLAWVLAIGLAVDDAIVVLENIHRHIELGKSRIQAAIDGVTELKHPIIVITLAVAIVFTPIGFVPGISGALFKEFAFTISLVVLVSGVLALFVSPVMCTHLLPKENAEDTFTKKLDRIFFHFRDKYTKVLKAVLDMRWLVLIVFIALSF